MESGINNNQNSGIDKEFIESMSNEESIILKRGFFGWLKTFFHGRSGLTIDDRVFIKHLLEQRDLQYDLKMAKRYEKIAEYLASIINKEFKNLFAEMARQEKIQTCHELKIDDHERRIEVIEEKLGLK